MNQPFKEGQVYIGYHDGKRVESRKELIMITDVIAREDMSDRAIGIWKKALCKDFSSVFNGMCYYITQNGKRTKQFWDWNCDLFYAGYIVDDEETKKDKILFAKCCKGYYGVNWNFELTNKKSKEERVKKND